MVDFIQNFRGDAGTRIPYAELVVSARLQARVHAQIPLGQNHLGQLDVEGADIFFHGLGGIGAQVHDDLMHLGRVRHHGVHIRIDLRPDFNGRGQGRSQQPERFLDQRSDLQRLEVAFALAAEGQDLAYQVAGPPGRRPESGSGSRAGGCSPGFRTGTAPRIRSRRKEYC